MTPRKPAGDGGDGGNEPTYVTEDRLNEFKDELLEAIGTAPRGGGRRRSRDDDDGGRPRGRQTDRDLEREAGETVEQAFARLDREKAHDAHHARLAEAETKARERQDKAGAKTPPAERNTLADFMGWSER